MSAHAMEPLQQAEAAVEILHGILHDALLAVYLHGSAATGGLRPQSDIDILAVIDRPVAEDQRRRLVAELLRASGRHPAVAGGPRPLEVMIFLELDLAAPSFPLRAEFVYGEWLRADFEAGALPIAVSDPEHTLVVAQAAREAIALYRTRAGAVLPEVSPEHIGRAMRDALPALVANLPGDERNVLLTLARIWHTAVTGRFVPKDAAASWALPRAPSDVADTLAHARAAYLGQDADDWASRPDAARRAADYLQGRVSQLLRSGSIRR